MEDKTIEQKKKEIKELSKTLIASKRFKNTILILFLVFFIGGYIVFFTSPLYMPADKSVYKLTPLNVFEELDSTHKFSVARWQYSEKEKKMEVEIDVDNTAFDGLNSYSYRVRTDPSAQVTVTPVIEENSLLILQLENIPNDFQIVSLQISLPGNVNSIIKLYTNVEAVERTDELPVLNKTEYQINRLGRNIKTYEENISELKNEIAKKENKIANIEQQNKELIQSKEFKTDIENEQINGKVQSNLSLIETEREEIKKLTADILENENRIKLIQEQISKIK